MIPQEIGSCEIDGKILNPKEKLIH